MLRKYKFIYILYLLIKKINIFVLDKEIPIELKNYNYLKHKLYL